MREIWRDIKGYEGLYQVSNLGRIKSLGNNKSRKEKIKSIRISKEGYEKVDLYKKGKIQTLFVHRLVAKEFIKNINSFEEINHKDENPRNNNVNNLEWCDRKYNINYGTRTQKCILKLKGRNAKPINQYDRNGVFIRHWKSITEASKELKINQGSISNCCKNINKTGGGYKWSYADS